MKRIDDLKSMSDDQLRERITELDHSLMRIRGFQHGGYGSDNPMMVRNLRKNKARCLTILKEREIEKKFPELKKHAKMQ